MRRIALIVVCALAVAHGHNRGSRRFTPSPFLEGQDLGFVPWRRTTPQPWAGQSGAWQPGSASAGSRGTSRRRTTPQPELGDNDIDDGFGNVSPAKETVRRTPVAPAAPPAVFRRQPQRTRTSVRRRQPARLQAATTEPEDDNVSEASTETSVATTASPSRRRTTTKAAETTTLSLLRQQVEALKKQARPSASISTSTKRFRGRRVKKIRRIIHPGDEDAGDEEEEEDEAEAEAEQELQKSEETAEKSEETAEKSEETAEKSSESTEDSSESATTTTTTQSPIILRRQKKIFRQPVRGRVGESRRQFSSRRRVVAPGTTEATISEPTTAPTVSISTSSPFEPFPLDEKDAENNITGEEGIGAAFTKLTSSAGGESSGTSSSSSSSASASSSGSAVEATSSSQSSSDEAESSSAENEISSGGATVRRPISRGSVRASSAFSQTGGSQQVSRGRGRARGSARGSVSSISSSSSSASASSSSSSSSSSSGISTSRREFARRRRPSASASVNAITTTPATTTTEAATTTTTAAAFDSTSTDYAAPTTTLSYGDDGLAFPNSLESDAPTQDQVSFNFGPATGRPFPTVTSSPSFGGFQPVNSGTFRFGSGTATRFGVTPRPVSSTTFAPAFNPTTPAFSTQFFEGNFGVKGFGPTTPVSATVFSNTIADSEFQPTPAPQPATFVSSSSRGSGSGRPNFGSFSFGATSSGSSSGSSSSSSSFGNNPFFNSVTARPTFRPTTAEPSTTSFGFSGPTVGSNSQRFGSQSTATTGGFRPISFSTRHPAPSFSSNTDNNVRISSNGAFSFGTAVAGPAVAGPDFGPRETTPRPVFTTFTTPRPFTSSFGFRPTSPSVRVPAVLTEAARFFGSQPGPTAQTNFGSSGGSVSSFSHATEHPAPGFNTGSFSFGTAATEASTLVQSLATSPAAPVTNPTEPPQIFGDVTEWPKAHSATGWPQTSPPATARPVSQPPLTSGQTFSQTNQQQNSIRNSLQEISRGPQKQHSVQKSQKSSAVSSSSSTSSQNSLGSVRSESSGRSFGSSTSSNSIFGRGGVRGFEFQQEGGIITRSSHLRGFDTRLPAFHENVVISDPVFTNKDIRPGFTCEGKPYGYYADEANDCKIFHICQPVDVSSVAKFYTRYSFFCGSETRFDQSKLSCLHDKDAMPCSETPSWLFRNDDFGKQEKRSDEQRFEEEVFNAPQAV